MPDLCKWWLRQLNNTDLGGLLTKLTICSQTDNTDWMTDGRADRRTNGLGGRGLRWPERTAGILVILTIKASFDLPDKAANGCDCCLHWRERCVCGWRGENGLFAVWNGRRCLYTSGWHTLWWWCKTKEREEELLFRPSVRQLLALLSTITQSI